MMGDIQESRQDGVYGSLLQQRSFAVRLLALGGIKVSGAFKKGTRHLF